GASESDSKRSVEREAAGIPFSIALRDRTVGAGADAVIGGGRDRFQGAVDEGSVPAGGAVRGAAQGDFRGKETAAGVWRAAGVGGVDDSGESAKRPGALSRGAGAAG